MKKFWIGLTALFCMTIVLVTYFSKPKYVSVYKPYSH